MNIIEPESSFSSYVNFTLSQTDNEVLNLLYYPIIGKDAFTIYSLFSSLSGLKGNDYFITHEEFCERSKISISDFLLARNKLEAIGLIETYRKEVIDSNSYKKVSYIYKLFPPATANKFFNDPILVSILKDSVGEKEIISLKSHFKESNNQFYNYINVSSKINDVFFYDKKEVSKDESGSYKEKKYKKTFQVNLAEIEKSLVSNDIDISTITKYEKQIEKYLTLYQIKDDLAVNIISSSISTGGMFDIDTFINKCKNAYSYNTEKQVNFVDFNKYNSKEDIEKYQSLPPKEFLTKLLNSEPTNHMLDKIHDIVERYNFTPDIINALFDYCLKSNNGLFNDFKIDELCIYLSYNKVTDLFSALQFLKRKDYKFEEFKAAKKRKQKTIVEDDKDSQTFSDYKKIDIKKYGLDL